MGSNVSHLLIFISLTLLAYLAFAQIRTNLTHNEVNAKW